MHLKLFTAVFFACFFSLFSVFHAAEDDSFKIPFKFPLFKQCNSSWGDNVIETDTICEVGCLLSSISMGLNYYKFQVNHKDVNPGTLNTWLQENNGYLKDDELIETALEKLQGVHYNGKFKELTHQQILNNLENGVITIAHVRNGTHFVLMTGFATTPSNHIWAVNDPGFDQFVYYTSDIVGFRVFSIKV